MGRDWKRIASHHGWSMPMTLERGNIEYLRHTWLMGLNTNKQVSNLNFPFLEQFDLALMCRLFYHLLNSIAGLEQIDCVTLLPFVHERHWLVSFSPSDERVNKQYRKPFSNQTMTVLSETLHSLNFSQSTLCKSYRSATGKHFLCGRRIVPGWNALSYTPEPKQDD